MEISGQASTDPLLSDEKWVFAATELRHATRVKEAIAKHGLTELVDVSFILSVLDGHGLFHQPIPAPKQHSKDIRRKAKAAANRLKQRIRKILSRCLEPANARERRLAEEWPRLGQTALYVEEEKIRCATYQTMRGGRIVPVGDYENRRPEAELTHALLLIEYHFEQTKPWSHAQRMACLTDIVSAVQDLRDEIVLVAARVRDRLREAKKREALHIRKSEYLDALSAVVVTPEMQELQERKRQFVELLRTLYSPESSAAEQEETAARLGPFFRVA